MRDKVRRWWAICFPESVCSKKQSFIERIACSLRFSQDCHQILPIYPNMLLTLPNMSQLPSFQGLQHCTVTVSFWLRLLDLPVCAGGVGPTTYSSVNWSSFAYLSLNIIVCVCVCVDLELLLEFSVLPFTLLLLFFNWELAEWVRLASEPHSSALGLQVHSTLPDTANINSGNWIWVLMFM